MSKRIFNKTILATTSFLTVFLLVLLLIYFVIQSTSLYMLLLLVLLFTVIIYTILVRLAKYVEKFSPKYHVALLTVLTIAVLFLIFFLPFTPKMVERKLEIEMLERELERLEIKLCDRLDVLIPERYYLIYFAKAEEAFDLGNYDLSSRLYQEYLYSSKYRENSTNSFRRVLASNRKSAADLLVLLYSQEGK